jgi:hypothetical protein
LERPIAVEFYCFDGEMVRETVSFRRLQLREMSRGRVLFASQQPLTEEEIDLYDDCHPAPTKWRVWSEPVDLYGDSMRRLGIAALIAVAGIAAVMLAMFVNC